MMEEQDDDWEEDEDDDSWRWEGVEQGEPWEMEADDPCNVLISNREAAEILGLSLDTVRYLARKGKLARAADGQPRKPFRLYEVLRLSRERDRKEARRPFAGSVAGKRSRERREFLRRWAELPMEPGDELVTRNRAAELLRVSPRRVSTLVMEGKLWGYQGVPGRNGSQMHFRVSHLISHAGREERAGRRAANEKGIRERREPVNAWEARGIGPMNPREPSARTEHNYGEFYTSRQAAMRLGIRVGTLKELRKRGRLQGYTRRKKNAELEPMSETRGRTWWFYRKDDVEELLADPGYREMKRRYRARMQATIPTDEELERQLEECVAIARENARRRERIEYG
jgi:phage terminase Nu1 subunit (DNA packaging protein)